MTGLDGIQGVQAKVEVRGTCSDRFAPVREAFTLNLETGQDIGASVAVLVDGEVVVDLWGGHLDGTYTRPWEKRTIARSFSSTKTVAALCALLLADRGELDLDAPVAKYWPDSPKARRTILVRQALEDTPPRWVAGICRDDPRPLRLGQVLSLIVRQRSKWNGARPSSNG